MIIPHYDQLCSAPSTLVIVASMLYGPDSEKTIFFTVFAGRHLTTLSVLYCLKYPPGVYAINLPDVGLRTDGG